MRELNALQEELEESRKRLKDVDETIKMLSSKDSNFSVEPLNRKDTKRDLKRRNSNERRNSSKKRQKSGDRASRRVGNDHTSSKEEEEEEEASGEDNDDDDHMPIPIRRTIQSSVVSKQKLIKSKEDLIKIQNKDTNSNQRNKRIFGMILNTLQKFKNEDQARSESSQARQRKEVETKLQVKEQEEKVKIDEEKNELVRERRRHEERIRIIEKKLQLTEAYQEWEKRQLCCRHFMRTKTKPFVYFKPRLIDETNEKHLKESFELVEDSIRNRKSEFEKEIEELEARENELIEAKHEINKTQDDNINIDTATNILKEHQQVTEEIQKKDDDDDEPMEQEETCTGLLAE